MDNKLLRFFNEIKLEEVYFDNFKEAKIEKVEVNIKKKIWIIHISFKSLINTEMFDILCSRCLNLKDVDKVKFKFSFENSDSLSDYFWYYFNKLVLKCPMLEGIKNNNIEINDNKIKFETLNKIEYDKIKDIKPKIEEFLNNMGFNANIEINVNKKILWMLYF